MRAGFEFLLGLLDRDEAACVAAEDMDGAHAPVLRLWQDTGFLDREPGGNTVSGCRWCGEGSPYALGDRLLCDRCRSVIDPRDLHLWRLHLPAVLDWFAGQWHL